LYGLYKQATEGDVPDIVTRPTAVEDEATRQKWSLVVEKQLIVGMRGTHSEDSQKRKLKGDISQV